MITSFAPVHKLVMPRNDGQEWRTNMKERRAKIIVLSILAVILVAAGVYIYSYVNRFVYNDPNLAGNTAGNTNNGGLFCEYNGYIYFSNPYDDGA